ncbi:hypothetical protein [Stenotrophomonas pictorum]|uniref:hypothetical protein n=1 Tax=Stenotrophomonas pictorum TaxID=86184 RepID=UPI0012FE684C|nr:hypothetical protein [Stenotrophomonas pictorum]
MSERSEFRAAPIREERREPMQLHRIGMRPAEAVWFLFAKTKGTRTRSVWKPLTLTHLHNKKAKANNPLWIGPGSVDTPKWGQPAEVIHGDAAFQRTVQT